MKLGTRWVSAAGVCLASLLPAMAAAEPKTHDGFFFQGSLGFGPGWLNEDVEFAGQSEEAKFSGLTGTLELLFGGTLAPGFVLGGGIAGHSIANPTFEYRGVEQETEDTSVGVSQLELFGKYYPQPQGGFYLHGSVGYGWGTVTVDDVTRDTNTSGPVLGAGLGYDFWVANEWSLGPQFRFTYARLTGDEDGIEWTDNFISPTLAFSVTYH